MALRRAGKIRSRLTRLRAPLWLAAMLVCAFASDLKGQQPQAILAPGEAAVTGFSGAPPPAEIAPGDDPAALTFIDLSGPSLRIVDLRSMDGPAAAQLVGAPKPFTVPASQIGQAFGVAIDDAVPPNLYVAATSAYGLPIVAPGPAGRLTRVKAGQQGAAYMNGLWGPHGGPGSIWKIDGATGRVTLFANVATDGRPNSGAALGALAYDPGSKSLFVADRESGLVHRYGFSGADLGAYDHGATGRAAVGLLPAPWTSREPIDLSSPAFDSAEPATWGLAAPQRRIFGLAIHEGRLYYAVADSLQIWSIGLRPDGSFGDDPIIELAVPPAAGPTEISTIAFDDQGRMLLAERAAATGAFDFEALAVPEIGRVLRYAVVGAAAGGRRAWQAEPDEYAIGFPRDLRNGDGGVAIGYNYDRAGAIIPGSCGGFVWSTGEVLRQPSDPALAAQLQQLGPLHVDGLQGAGVWQDRPRNVPPLASFYISYIDGPSEDAARGWLGAVAIRRDCAPPQRAGFLTPAAPAAGPSAPSLASGPPGLPQAPPGKPPAAPPGKPPGPPGIPPSTPPGGCPADQVRRVSTGACEPSCQRPDIQIGGRCCPPAALAANAACSNSSCPAGETAIGPSNFCCNSAQVYAGAGGAPACCAGALVNGKCEPVPKPPVCAPSAANPSCCPSGYASAGGACCLASKITSTGVCCPTGQTPTGPNNNACGPIFHAPIGPLCCASGLIPTASGACCAPANVTTTGICCSAPVDPSNRGACPAQTQVVKACASGYAKMPDGSCCANRFVSHDGRACLTGGGPRLPPPACPAGEERTRAGTCAPLAAPACPPGKARTREGACEPIPPAACPPGYARYRPGPCTPIPSRACRPGEERTREGACVETAPPPCPPGETRTRAGACVQTAPPPCPPGETRTRAGACAPLAAPACPPGFARNLRGLCVRAPPLFCPPGTFRNRFGYCIPFGAPPAGPFGPPRRGPFLPPPGGGLAPLR
jgi:hypothetical protein